MLKKILLVGLAILTAACVPITPEPTAATETLQTPEPTQAPEPKQASESTRVPTMVSAHESFADCPDGTLTDATDTQVIVDFFEMLPGQMAADPFADNIPDYVDIVRVESNLDGETLTAILYLRGIPEELEIIRKGAGGEVPEYMWMIHIDVDGEDEPESERFEYLLGAYSFGNIGLTDAPSITVPFEEGVQSVLWDLQNSNRLIDVPVDPRLFVSREDNTLTLVSEVPGIAAESTLMISTMDSLLGYDAVSCQPG